MLYPAHNITWSIRERAVFYKSVLKASGQTVLLVSLPFALFSLQRNGFGGAVAAYLMAVTISTLVMCIFLLVALPVVFMSEKPLHPAVMSLLAMIVLPGVCYLVGLMVAADAGTLMGAFTITGVAMLYGAPIGFIMRGEGSSIREPG